MDCRSMQSRCAAYLDGDLPPGARMEAERHLASCDECREALESLRDFDAACREALAFPGAPYAFSALRKRMAEIVPLDEVTAFLPHLKIQGAIPRFAVAVLMLMLTGGASGALRHCHVVYTAARQPFLTLAEQCEDSYQDHLDETYRKTMQRKMDVVPEPGRSEPSIKA